LRSSIIDIENLCSLLKTPTTITAFFDGEEVKISITETGISVNTNG
jgi:hypothetical protein